MMNMDLEQMTRDELLGLQDQVKNELKSFRPYRIKSRVVQCGVANCWCSDGDEGHGPYLYVIYRENGKTKQNGLGVQYDQHDFDNWCPHYPSWSDVFSINPDEYGRLTVDQAEDYVHDDLTDREFQKRYGFSKAEDKFGMFTRFYGRREDVKRYWHLVDIYQEEALIPQNKWARFGVGTLSGIAFLSQLEDRKYFLWE